MCTHSPVSLSLVLCIFVVRDILEVCVCTFMYVCVCTSRLCMCACVHYPMCGQCMVSMKS